MRYFWGGSPSDGIVTVTQLPTPKLTEVINDYVYWEEVPNASSYVVKINSYQESAGNQLKYSIASIMDSRIEYDVPTELHIYVKAKGNQVLYSDSEWSSELTYNYTKKSSNSNSENDPINNSNSKEQLEWPTNLKMNDNVLTWDKVNNAIGYELKIDGDSKEYTTATTSYDFSNVFTNSTTFKVQLRSLAAKNADFEDSEWTVLSPFTYKQNSVKTQIGFSDTYKSNGLGRTIDLINSNSYKPKSGTGYIFDENALFNRNLIEETIKDQTATYEYGTSFDSFYSKWKADIDVKVAKNTLGINGNNFLPGTADFNIDVKGGYEQVRKGETQELYIKMHQNIIGKSVELSGHASEYDYYASILSDNFKNAASKVKDERTAEQFINTWGTHVIMAAYYGAAFEASYYNISHDVYNEDDWYVGVEAAVKAHLFFSDVTTDISAGLSHDSNSNSKNTLSKFEAYAIGGNSVALASDLGSFQEAYKKWADGVNESNYTIIDFPENSLYCIWDFLDNSYSEQKTILNNYMIKKCGDKLESIKNKLNGIYKDDKLSFELINNNDGTATIESVNGTKLTNNYQFVTGDIIKIKAEPKQYYNFLKWNVVKGNASGLDLESSDLEISLLDDMEIEPIYYLKPGMKTISFAATLKTESTKQGDITFTLTGIPVLYGNKEYIYGNAYFENSISGGSRFNDVDRISLVLKDKVALFGGIMTWYGSKDDSNEAGSAAWDPTYSHNSYELSYLERSADDDFAGNERVGISIIGICVCVGNKTLPDDAYPVMTQITFNADIWTEGDKQDRVVFNMYGINAIYDDSEYFYGCAYYSGNMNKKRFNDVASISLRNCEYEILNGGSLIYRGTKGDFNESGLYSNLVINNNSKDCYYMAEDGNNDFAGDENVIISITNIIIKTNDNARDDVKHVRLLEKEYKASVHAETEYEGEVYFKVIGFECQMGNDTYIIGNAGVKSKFNGNRVNDNDRIELGFENSVVLNGGLLQYNVDWDDWNTQQAAYSCVKQLSMKVIYYADNCGDDFPGKSENNVNLFINGICVMVK